MKKTLLIGILLNTATFASEEGKNLHNQSCVACHVVQHNADFYTREDRRIVSLPKLGGQVSRCVSTLGLEWFPDEEKSVVDYLNNQYYKFK